MVLSLTATGIQSDATDTGTYTWADVIALNSPKLIAHTTTNSKTIYRWTGLLVLNGTAILTINSQTVEFLRLAVDGGSRGQVYLNNSAKLIISSSTILVTYYDFTYREDDSRSLLRSQSATASIEIYESSIAFGAASNPINISGGSKMEIQASLMRNCSCTVPNLSYETAVVKIKPDSASFSNTLLNLVDCSVGSATATSANFSNIFSYGALNAFTNWGSANGLVLRDFRASGSPVNDYYADTTTYTTFVDCGINLANGQVMKNNLVLAQGNYKKGASHNLKLTDSIGNISNALVRYIGRTNVSAVSSSGSVSEFILIFQETNLIGQPNPGLAYAVYPKPLAILDFSAYTREVRSYLHNGRSELITVGDKIGSIALPFEISLLVDSGITQTVQATAAAATGIAHTATAITVSISRSIAEIYDSRKAYWRDNGGTSGVRIGAIADFGNINITIATGVSIAPSVAKFPGGVQTSGVITLTDARTYNDVPVSVASGGSITASAGGNFNIQGWIGSGTTISSSAPSIFTVDSSQINNFIAGTNVTLQTPQANIRFHGMPNVSNTILFVQDLTTNAIIYPTIANGEAIVTVNAARNYKIRADAPGYLASPFVTISGASVDYQFGLTDYRALYLSGVNRSSQITFNPTTYLITISDLTPTLSFADVFVTIEDYLATPQGLNYTAHPYPVVLSDRNILQFPYDTTTNAVNPARIKPAVGNTTDPALLFETYLERAADPSYGLFDFSTSNGRIIRIRSVVAIAQVASATISPSQQQIRDALTIPASVITVAGSIDSKLALIPTTDASIPIAAIKTQTDKLVFTTVGRVDSTAIGVPTNPLVTTDSRLSNLDALISSRATQTSVSAIPINPLITTDSRLNNLDASISANSPINIWNFATRSLTVAFPTVPTATQNATAVRTELTIELGRLNQSVSTIFTSSDRAILSAIPTNNYSANLTAIQSSINALPTNPVLINDARLNNLDALISSRATQISVNALPTLAAIEGSIVLFKYSNYIVPDNAGIGLLNSKLSSVRTDSLDRLPNLDVLVSSRSTPDQVWAVPYAGLTQTGTIGRLLYWVGKLFGVTSTTVTASNTARTTGDGTINQTITTNADNSKTMNGNP